MRALLTGAAGFIGHKLAIELVRQGHDVVGVDNLTDYYDPVLKRANLEAIYEVAGGAYRHHQKDLATDDLQSLFGGVDVVFHLAGQPGVRRSWGSYFDSYNKANVLATQRLLEASNANGVSRFVYASSSSIYGDAESFPTLETAVPRPRSPYGVTKLAAEHLCSLYATNFGVPTVSLRYFTVFGPGQRPDMAFTRFCRAAITGSEISVFGSGEQRRDFTYVDDVVEANILAAKEVLAPGSVLNIAGGTDASVNEVLGLLESMAEKPLQIRRHEPVPGDVQQTGGDSSLARRSLGWEPKTGLEEGLARQFEWALEAVRLTGA